MKAYFATVNHDKLMYYIENKVQDNRVLCLIHQYLKSLIDGLVRASDEGTLGRLFYELCDEVNELDWAVALQQLIELFQDVLKEEKSTLKKLIERQLQQWIDGLPNYLKAYLPISSCES